MNTSARAEVTNARHARCTEPSDRIMVMQFLSADSVSKPTKLVWAGRTIGRGLRRVRVNRLRPADPTAGFSVGTSEVSLHP